jgi:uncharacterized protein (TIGR02598 family)
MSLHSRAQAFSLVEVTLAMGVFAFALVSLLGLMPIAFQASRDSLDMTIVNQAADQLAAEIQQNKLPPAENGPFYFDNEGRKTTSTSAIFQAEIQRNPTDSSSLTQVQITVSRSIASKGRHFCFQSSVKSPPCSIPSPHD